MLAFFMDDDFSLYERVVQYSQTRNLLLWPRVGKRTREPTTTSTEKKGKVAWFCWTWDSLDLKWRRVIGAKKKGTHGVQLE